MQSLLMFCCLLCFVVLVVSGTVVRRTDESEGKETVLEDKVLKIVKDILNGDTILAREHECDQSLVEEMKNLRVKVSSMEMLMKQQSEAIAELKTYITELHAQESVDEAPRKIAEKEIIINPENKPENDMAADGQNDDGSNESAAETRILFQRLRRASVGNVAFSAYLSTTNYHTVIGAAIKFDKILLNDGHGYNAYTGAFTAPLSGVYLFSFHFDTTKLTFIRLVVNGVNQVDAVANQHLFNNNRSQQSMGGNTAIIHVQHGQSVLVETFEVSDGATASSENFHFCTFSGVLLY